MVDIIVEDKKLYINVYWEVTKKMFTKTTKRVFSLILCVLMLVPFMTIMSSAYVADPDATERIEARNKFSAIKKGGEIEKKSWGKTEIYHTEYRVYSPEKGGEHPVVFLIGKQTTADSNSNDLRHDSFAFWANDEYQSRFYNAKGAYIVYVRPAVEKEFESFKLMMEEFFSEYGANIDKDRIYLVGWDKGCDLAVRIAKDKDSHITALVLSSPREIISSYPSIPVWLIASRNDEAVSYDLTECWSNLKMYTSLTVDIRFTAFNSFNSRGEKNHETWEYVAYDTNYPGFENAKTVNGRDAAVEEKSIIGWMSKFGTDYGSDCTCPCHGTDDMIEKIKWFFKWMISMMLKIEKNRPCACGGEHW